MSLKEKAEPPATPIDQGHLQLARDANLKILAALSAILEEEGHHASLDEFLRRATGGRKGKKDGEPEIITPENLKGSQSDSPFRVALRESLNLVTEIFASTNEKSKHEPVLWMSFALDNLRLPDNVEESSFSGNHDFGLNDPLIFSKSAQPRLLPATPSITKEVVVEYLKQASQKPHSKEQTCFGIFFTKNEIENFKNRECVHIHEGTDAFCSTSDLPSIFVEPMKSFNGRITGEQKWNSYISHFAGLIPDGESISCQLSATCLFNSLLNPKLKAAAQIVVGTNVAPTKQQADQIYHLLQIVLSGLPVVWSAITRLAQDNLALRKYKDVLNLLQLPLDRLNGAIHSVQQDIRQLGAVLHEPAEALFRHHKTLVDLFEDGKEIELSKTVKIKVEHGSKYSNSEQVRLILAIAVCKIFGCESDLKDNATTHEKAIEYANTQLEKYISNEAYRELIEDLLFISFPRATETLSSEMLPDILSEKKLHDENQLCERISNLKDVLFSPFKFAQMGGWRPRALQLALKRFGQEVEFYEVNDKQEPILFSTDSRWEIDNDWTPVGYGAVLDFLLKCCSEFRNRSSGNEVSKVTARRCLKHLKHKEFYICVYFKGKPFVEDGRGIRQLQQLLNKHIFQFPRDWRVDQATLGNFQKPFVDLGNKLLGRINVEQLPKVSHISGWINHEVELKEDGDNEYELMRLEHQLGDNRSRYFVLCVGSTLERPGISLRWFEDSTSEYLSKFIIRP